MRLVLNKCFGRFGLSELAVLKMANNGCDDLVVDQINRSSCGDVKARSNPFLIQVVEELGSEKVSGFMSFLIVEEIPQGTKYLIKEYDGYEEVVRYDERVWSVAWY